MGYDIHITRARNWFENEGSLILLDEWLAYVESDPEMRRDDFAEAETPSGRLRYENPGLSVWMAYSSHGEDGNMAWFDFRDGNVVVKNPDEEIVVKMCRIAEVLHARVQGDDGEYYPESLPQNPSSPQVEESPKVSWWRKLLGGA